MVIDNPYFKQQKDWWDKDEQNLSGVIYSVNGTEIIVGNRPDLGTTRAFFSSIDGWINISDRLVLFPKGSLSQWSPWNEDGSPQYETLFSVLKTLNYWVNDLKLNRIFINCDAGTHRSVTLFGFYLLAYHQKNCEEINNNYRLFNRKDWSNPLEYANTYLNRESLPLLEDFLMNLKENTKHIDNVGTSLEGYLKTFDRKKLRDYYLDRAVYFDLKMLFLSLKRDIYFFFYYSCYKTPISKFRIFVHKKLNTKLGKWYKDHGF